MLIFSRRGGPEPGPVFDTMLRFAVERQRIWFRRLAGHPPPWTMDPHLAAWRFTNVYRATDRVSQALIRDVQAVGPRTPREVFFRTVLFRVFNRPETWGLLQQQLGPASVDGWRVERVDAALTRALDGGEVVFSGAYVMPARGPGLEDGRKHRNWLHLVERMLRDEVPERLRGDDPHQAFRRLRAYPMIGDFLAYQLVTDLGYAGVWDLPEDRFTAAGPGARSGLRKCFVRDGGLSDAELIRWVQERWEAELAARGLRFVPLWGRPPQLIDVQNVLCEVDKLARLVHPQVRGDGDRHRLKRRYVPGARPPMPRLPSHWGLDGAVRVGLPEGAVTPITG